MNIHVSDEAAPIGMQVLYLRDTESRSESPLRVLARIGWVPAEGLSKAQVASLVALGDAD